MTFFFTKTRRDKHQNRGFSLVETIVYIVILLLVLVVVVNALALLTRSFRTIQSTQTIESTAQIAMERMTRDIRDALSINVTQSTLGTSPGQLTINTQDEAGTATTIKFFLSGQAIRIAVSDTDIGPLSNASARVTNLVFRSISSTQSNAVKIEMTVESGQGASYKVKNFYSTVVMRGSYPVQ
ncbi:MAG: prepilin-type N-terminal cleavage/methylation domain-containing protein [bacterium]|nr:prepilin-type N-terminal cleavage/methylation domain-containing protein [bacterium]